MRIDLVLNRNAAQLRRRPQSIEDVRRIAGSAARLWATSSFDDLDHAAREIARNGSDRVVLGGGDGTFMAGVTALHHAFGDEMPVVVFAPAGTVATVARGFGHRADLRSTVARVVADPASLPLVCRPTLRVEDDAAARVGFIAAAGLASRFFDVYYAQGGDGLPAAARIALEVAVGAFTGGALAREVLEPVPCSITVDGRRLAPEAWSLAIASVVRDVGLHVIVNHRAGEDPERPHFVATPDRIPELRGRIHRVLRGRPLLGDRDFDGLVEQATLDFGDDPPRRYVLDGDRYATTRLTIRAGPPIRLATF